MKNKILVVCVLSLFLVLFNVAVSVLSSATEQHIVKVNSTQSLTTEEIEAEAVLNSYFNALVDGDSIEIEKLLGGKFLDKVKRLLSNPNYAASLREIYGNASFEILNMNVKGNNTISIDSDIYFNDKYSMRVRYFMEKPAESTNLTPPFRIIKEIELTNEDQL
ncbi:MAG: hypothetical protein GY928_10300 [Colwellia sp.]|nr:hypothetical protein [Colwellia sp.]